MHVSRQNALPPLWHPSHPIPSHLIPSPHTPHTRHACARALRPHLAQVLAAPNARDDDGNSARPQGVELGSRGCATAWLAVVIEGCFESLLAGLGQAVGHAVGAHRVVDAWRRGVLAPQRRGSTLSLAHAPHRPRCACGECRAPVSDSMRHRGTQRCRGGADAAPARANLQRGAARDARWAPRRHHARPRRAKRPGARCGARTREAPPTHTRPRRCARGRSGTWAAPPRVLVLRAGRRARHYWSSRMGEY